ncbi:uncharacterized protein LOC104581295 [Brachypodium distachyon]|uniref:HMA domain-containing protein n=1 Tax=Brachypodium distachyon TaxID=15368 RepID=A0A0Q3EDR9_BRADI|nr:uncharacterized protein LOC104581295 [Brachypodium distachyon]KQJ84596.1 hypothetical protein BRADI_5g21790v3 [Brachypodium distachyon]|eukprot:XP_014751253.1 uncharacterized protein LOC104581295 [Brachypodium distachyon]
MAKEEELKRVELKVNVSCCEGCRRKVMRAMSLKGVLRTEIHPSLERVTVVGNVDAQVLVRKLAKVGKIAEPVSAAAQSLPPKRRDADGDGHGGAGNVDKPAMAMALVPASVGEKTSKRKDDDGCKVDTGAAVASNKKECSKCAHQQGKRKDDDAGDRGKKAVSKDLEERDAFGGAGKGKPSSPEHEVAQQQYYHRAEPPSMAVPVQYVPAMPYYAAANVAAAPGYYGGGGGYYAMPPPPPVAMPWRPEQQQLRPQQPSRFDVDYFNEDNAVGCRVM